MSYDFITDQQASFEMIYVRLHHLPPLGYRIEGPYWKFLHDETVAPIVKRIWAEALQGLSVRKITNLIEAEYQFRTPIRGKTGGRPLHRTTVNAILKDLFYAGYVRLGERICKGLHEPFVSPEDFLRVQRQLAKRQKN